MSITWITLNFVVVSNWREKKETKREEREKRKRRNEKREKEHSAIFALMLFAASNNCTEESWLELEQLRVWFKHRLLESDCYHYCIQFYSAGCNLVIYIKFKWKYVESIQKVLNKYLNNLSEYNNNKHDKIYERRKTRPGNSIDSLAFQ